MSLKSQKRSIPAPSSPEREHGEPREQERVARTTYARISKGQVAVSSGTARLFDNNMPKLMRPEQVAAYLDISVKTIYDWRHRGSLRGVPKELFLSLNRRLHIRTKVLLDWMSSQNPGAIFRE